MYAFQVGHDDLLVVRPVIGFDHSVTGRPSSPLNPSDHVTTWGDFLDEVAVMTPEGVLAHVIELGRPPDWNFLLEHQPVGLGSVVHLHPPSAPCGPVRLRRRTPENVDALQRL